MRNVYPLASLRAQTHNLRADGLASAGMNQARAAHHPEPDEDLPPLPAERKSPEASDEIPELAENEPPVVEAETIPPWPEEPDPPA